MLFMFEEIHCSNGHPSFENNYYKDNQWNKIDSDRFSISDEDGYLLDNNNKSIIYYSERLYDSNGYSNVKEYNNKYLSHEYI